MDRSEAVALTDYAVLRGEIPFEKAGRLVHHLQQGSIMRNNKGQWVCSFCGGNCGQCGMTDFVGNVPYSFDRIEAGINPPGKKPLDIESKRAGYNKNTVRIVVGYLAVAAALAFVSWMLTGCAPTGMPCTSCIGPYDITLSSHREALLGHP